MTPVRPEMRHNGTGAINGIEEDSDMEEDKEGEGRESEEQEGEEAEEVRVRSSPNQPTERELQDHMATHVPFCPWCPLY